MPKAKIEFRMENNEPSVAIRVPRGTSLGDLAKIQSSLFASPERVPPEFGKLIRGCPNCLSGLHIGSIREEIVNPVTHDLQDMFTHLTTEMRSISTRLANLERSAPRAEPAETATGQVAEIEF